MNFRRFISWWQKKMKVSHSAARITDEELQVCQKIWHEFDDDGNGVNQGATYRGFRGLTRPPWASS